MGGEPEFLTPEVIKDSGLHEAYMPFSKTEDYLSHREGHCIGPTGSLVADLMAAKYQASAANNSVLMGRGQSLLT